MIWRVLVAVMVLANIACSAPVESGAPSLGAPSEVWCIGGGECETAPPNADELPANVVAEVPVIALYTVGVGESLFERFGHAALCVHRSQSPRSDLCFNYGATEFSTPLPLIWDFLRGRANVWVARSTPAELLEIYRDRDRTVWRQDLPLPDDQAMAIARRLMVESRPENAHFNYHHSADNCATRLRDLLDEETGGVLSRSSDATDGRTFRDVWRNGMAESTAVLLLTNVILGRAIDAEMTAWEAMFLPDGLRTEVQIRFRVRAAPVLVLERQGRRIPKEPGYGGLGWVLLAALFLAAAVLASRRWPRWRRSGLILAFGPLGLIGLLPWTLAIVSTLQEMRWNEVLFILTPVDLFVPWFPRRWRDLWVRARLVSLLLVLVALALGLFVQPLGAFLVLVALPYLVTIVPLVSAAAQGEAKTKG